jgi:hypothetical protein
MTNVVFWDVKPCDSSKNGRIEGTYRLHHQSENNLQVRNNVNLLITADAVPSSLILFILIMETIRSSETSVLTTATRRHIPEDGILHFPD